ncbi:hypothetical protein KAJ27_17305 [bacterium]|nr:hypothetical protein [Bacteroidales bacterium]MCK5685893.1 hypothetical protein [bacterium]
MKKSILILILIACTQLIMASVSLGMGKFTASVNMNLSKIVTNVTQTPAIIIKGNSGKFITLATSSNSSNSILTNASNLNSATNNVKSSKAKILFQSITKWLKKIGSKKQISGNITKTTDIRKMDEKYEKMILGGKNKPGKLVFLSGGSSTTAICIHGLINSPDRVTKLDDWAKNQGYTSYTFCYDDCYRSLWDNADDLAREIERYISVNPGRKIIINTHSLGGRIALGALNYLMQRRVLSKTKFDVNLMAPPIDGFVSANISKIFPGKIKMSKPLKDLGSKSKYQKMLAKLKLPSNVRLVIYSGGKDKIVPADRKFFKMVRTLNAISRYFPSDDHHTLVPTVAKIL